MQVNVAGQECVFTMESFTVTCGGQSIVMWNQSIINKQQKQ